MAEDGVAEGMATDGMVSNGASAEEAAIAGGAEEIGTWTEGAANGNEPAEAGAGAKDGAAIAGIVPVFWADTTVNGRIRIRLGKIP
jgi:hypothetical protein